MKSLIAILICMITGNTGLCLIHTIQVKDFEYSPATISCMVGDTIKFQWVEGNHPTISDNGNFADISLDILHPAYLLAFNVEGTYNYHCLFHGSAGGNGMAGKIIVNSAVSDCDIPIGISINEITPTSVLISWTSQANAIKYKINYRPVGTSEWTIKGTTFTSKIVKNLLPQTQYEYKIKTVCNMGSSSFSPKNNFTTLPQRIDNNYPTEPTFTVFPNPCIGVINISTSLRPDEIVELEVLDMSGRALYSSHYNFSEVINLINLPSSTKGIVLLKIMGKEWVEVKKVLVL